MLQRISRFSNVSRHVRYLNNISWLENNNTIYTIGIDSKFKNRVEHVSVNPKDYISKNEDLIYLSLDKFVQPISVPFDCRIISENTGIHGSLKSKFSDSSDLWIVKIEPVNMAVAYILEQINHDSNSNHIQELIYMV